MSYISFESKKGYYSELKHMEPEDDWPYDYYDVYMNETDQLQKGDVVFVKDRNAGHWIVGYFETFHDTGFYACVPEVKGGKPTDWRYGFIPAHRIDLKKD